MARGLALIDADGVTHNLLDYAEGVDVSFPLKGFYSPRFELTEDKLPFASGSKIRGARAQARDIPLPMLFRAADENEYRDLIDTWAGLLQPDPTRGPLTLRHTREDGGVRDLKVYPMGLDAEESIEQGFAAHVAQSVVMFRAPDPLWTEFASRSESFSSGASRAFFPWPWTLGVSAVYAGGTVDNPGHVEVWPVWTITGPGGDITITNNTTGEAFSITGHTLLAGQQITVDLTDPANRTVTDQDGNNLMAFTSGTFWAFGRGTTSFDADFDGTTSASTVQYSFNPRWLSP